MSFIEQVENSVADIELLSAFVSIGDIKLDLPEYTSPAVQEFEQKHIEKTHKFVLASPVGAYNYAHFLQGYTSNLLGLTLMDMQAYRNANLVFQRKAKALHLCMLLDQMLAEAKEQESKGVPPKLVTTSKSSSSAGLQTGGPEDNSAGTPAADEEEEKKSRLVFTAEFAQTETQLPELVDHARRVTEASDRPPPIFLFDEMYQLLLESQLQHFEAFLSSSAYQRYVCAMVYAGRKVSLSSFNIFRKLGRGAFGVVSGVQHQDTRAMFAMKQMDMLKMKSKRAARSCVMERDVLAAVDSPFVVKLHYAFTDAENAFLLLELCEGGDLKFHLTHAMEEEKKPFSRNLARFYAAEILVALDNVHSAGFIYRDMKPHNVLLDGEGHVKLTDFGLCIRYKKDRVLCHVAGTAGYWAPEIVSRSGTYFASDVWSWAVCLYEMLTGERPEVEVNQKNMEWTPFALDEKNEEIAKQCPENCVLKVKYDAQYIDPVAQDLLEKIFVADRKKRLGAVDKQEIMNHEFFKGVNWDDIRQRRAAPEWVPEDLTVHAKSIADLSVDEDESWKDLQLDQSDRDNYADFYFVNAPAAQLELAQAMYRLDNEKDMSKDKSAGCCVLL